MQHHEETMHAGALGTLEIDGWVRIELADDLLAHVALIMFAKLRRSEPLLMSWTDSDGATMQMWVQPTATIRVTHHSEANNAIDRMLAERMMVAANSSHGLCLTTEAIEHRKVPTPPATRYVTAAAS